MLFSSPSTIRGPLVVPLSFPLGRGRRGSVPRGRQQRQRARMGFVSRAGESRNTRTRKEPKSNLRRDASATFPEAARRATMQQCGRGFQPRVGLWRPISMADLESNLRQDASATFPEASARDKVDEASSLVLDARDPLGAQPQPGLRRALSSRCLSRIGQSPGCVIRTDHAKRPWRRRPGDFLTSEAAELRWHDCVFRTVRIIVSCHGAHRGMPTGNGPAC